MRNESSEICPMSELILQQPLIRNPKLLIQYPNISGVAHFIAAFSQALERKPLLFEEMEIGLTEYLDILERRDLSDPRFLSCYSVYHTLAHCLDLDKPRTIIESTKILPFKLENS